MIKELISFMAETAVLTKRRFYLLLFAFVTCYFIGTFTALFLSSSDMAALSRSLPAYLKAEEVSLLTSCIHNALTNLSLLVICLTAYVSPLLSPLSVLALLYKAVCCGFTCTFLFESTSEVSSLKAALPVFPELFIVLPIFFAVALTGISFSRINLRPADGKPFMQLVRLLIIMHLAAAALIVLAGLATALIQQALL